MSRVQMVCVPTPHSFRRSMKSELDPDVYISISRFKRVWDQPYHQISCHS